MHVKLKIQEDKDLRNYIKDMIKGQVKSLLREEIEKQFREIVLSKIKKNNIDIVKRVNEIIEEKVKKELSGGWSKKSIWDIANEKISKTVITMFRDKVEEMEFWDKRSKK